MEVAEERGAARPRPNPRLEPLRQTQVGKGNRHHAEVAVERCGLRVDIPNAISCQRRCQRGRIDRRW
jgi:hypothetical protein